MDKVYTPLVIPDNPLPGQSPVTQSVTTGADSSTSQVSQPYSMPDSIVPRKVVAHETIGETLNTKSKKIQADYSFTEQGSLQVGSYKPGVSGDVRISPNGIVARDLAGNPTFTLDGDTGDATFAGQIMAGTEIVGEVILGSGQTVLDEEGIVSTTNFLKATSTHGITQTFATTSYEDLTNSEMDFTLTRPTLVLFMATMPMYVVEGVGNSGDGVMFIDIDGVKANAGAIFVFSGNNFRQTYSIIYPVTLSAGSHIVKLTAKMETISSGSPNLTITEYNFHRIHLGS